VVSHLLAPQFLLKGVAMSPLLPIQIAQADGSLLQNSTLIFWGAITLIVLVPTLAYCWAAVRKADAEAALKHEMIQRGMSAEEIERVLKAKSPD
jgi:hypothetical protein